MYQDKIPVAYCLDDVMPFGRLKGYTISHIIEFHRDYFAWMAANLSHVKFTNKVWQEVLGRDGDLESWRNTTATSD